MRAVLSSETVEAAINEVVGRFQAHHVSGTWHLGPSMRPVDLKERLVAHGFTYGGLDTGMAADLHALNEAVAFPDTLMIERVRDDQSLDLWSETLAQGFGEGPREAYWVRDVYRQIGLAVDDVWRHYLGRLGGAPVATTSLFMTPEVAGIYFVMTLPQARRQGIGAAVTLAALRDARDLGYRVGVLGASDAGLPVYRRLGFREYCSIEIYEWRVSDYKVPLK